MKRNRSAYREREGERERERGWRGSRVSVKINEEQNYPMPRTLYRYNDAEQVR